VPGYAKTDFSPAVFHFTRMPSKTKNKSSNGNGEARDDCRSVFGIHR
jgi:hypothetical protein